MIARFDLLSKSLWHTDGMIKSLGKKPFVGAYIKI